MRKYCCWGMVFGGPRCAVGRPRRHHNTPCRDIVSAAGCVEKQTNLRRPARRAQARAAEGMPHPMFRSCLGAGCGRAGWWRQQRQSCVGGGRGRQRRRNVHSRLKRAWRPVWWCCGGGGGGGARVFGCRRGQRQACRARFVLWLHLGAGGGRARGVMALAVVVALRRTWSCMGVDGGVVLTHGAALKFQDQIVHYHCRCNRIIWRFHDSFCNRDVIAIYGS